MRNPDVIRLSSSEDLGSLEDISNEKRMSVSQIRKLRRQAHEQTNLKHSILRGLAKWFAEVSSQLQLLLARRSKQTYCQLNGHSITRIGLSGFAPRCKFCGVEIGNIEELQSVR